GLLVVLRGLLIGARRIMFVAHLEISMSPAALPVPAGFLFALGVRLAGALDRAQFSGAALCAYGARIGHAAPEVARAADSPGAGTRRDSSQASRSRSKIPRRLLPNATMAGPPPIESSRSMERRVRLARFAASSNVRTCIDVSLPHQPATRD